ncbi:MAG: type I DNA topoisomerase [Acidimicrobiia bacterium]|nr:type I DNA topoisomerase [Acidimicrobiia bacterium]
MPDTVAGMAHTLVIVESPAKARTIARFLGDGYVVEASMGHVRDLPRKASELPARYRDRPWARLGVDVDGDFEPVYVVPKDKAARVKALRLAVRDAHELLLATDGDREGESIAWHVLEVTKPSVPLRRMVFHEITPLAIRRALEDTRDLDTRLVAAQETRRVLDRLVGWDLSELLWKKVAPKLSAGRVQSVATKLVVDRERARIAFRSGTWWEVRADFEAVAGRLQATLTHIDDARVAVSRDFDAATGEPSDAGLVLLDEPHARRLAAASLQREFEAGEPARAAWRRRPAPPFVTASLQQEAWRRLRLSAARTMQLAQRLYESGHITYMRTDSVELGEEALGAARADVRELFGDAALPAKPRRYRRKGKHAQEAHEAIRPTGPRFARPDEIRGRVEADAARLYELIWRRTLGSQMTDAVGFEIRVDLVGTVETGQRLVYTAAGRIVTDAGFLAVWDEPNREVADETALVLDRLTRSDRATCRAADPEGHATQPPGRYTEASLVKELERLGVGRPSTYAAILRTIVDRGYVRRAGGSLVPTWAAFAVVQLLERHFPDLVDAGFTAGMEEALDDIAAGAVEAVPWLRAFYLGAPPAPGLRDAVAAGAAGIDAREVTTISLHPHDADGPFDVHFGRYGPYVEADAGRIRVPEDLAPDELTGEKLTALVASGAVASEDRALGADPDSGEQIVLRHGPYGPYVQRGEGKSAQRVGLLRSTDPDSVSLDTALALLGLPRLVGSDDDGVEITVHTGRHGPYLKRGRDTRSIEDSLVFTIAPAQALEILARPKARAGRPRVGKSAATGGAGLLADLGTHPETGQHLVVRDGRYGPYVTDGKTNASIPKGTAPSDVTVEGAVELLRRRADSKRRGRNPRKRRRRA